MSTKKQKLATKKLEKEVSKTYNIKVLWQRNHNLDLNFKANIPILKLAESSEFALVKKKTLLIFFLMLLKGGQKHPFYYNKKFDKINKWKH